MSEPSRPDADLERALLLGRRLRTVGGRAAARRAPARKPSSGMRPRSLPAKGEVAGSKNFGSLSTLSRP
jgi:hypothetical protein